MAEFLNPQDALRQLAEHMAELSRAAEAGNLDAAGQALAHRQTAVEELLRSAESRPLEPGQLEQLDQILRQAGASERSLIVYRENCRSVLGELEAERLRLHALASHPGKPSKVDVEA